MNVLVTGAAGLLGSSVASALIGRGASVRAVDFSQPNVQGAECIAADTTDAATCIRLGAGMDCIAHLGAFHGAHLERNRGPKNEGDFFDANIAGSFHFMRSAVENKVPSFVWASSTVVYERGTWRIFGIYSLSKVVGEEFCQYFNTEHGLKIIGLRYGTFGSRDFLGTGFGMLGTTVHGNMIRTEEVVRVTLAAVENESINYGMYDVQTPLPFSPSEEWSYLQGNRVEVLAQHWPQHRELIERYVSHLPPAINTVRMARTQKDLGVTIEHDFGWFLDELARREAAGTVEQP